MTNAEWVKLRLPPGANFSKNGVTLTVDAAVTDALDEAEDDRRVALVSLLRLLLSNIEFDSETLGSYSYDRPTLQAQIDYWQGQVDDATGSSFSSVTADFGEEDNCGEFSRRG